MDLDLRKIRYFMAVAEHLNFGRAAQSLHIAQPVLSRQIRALEDELKAQLFTRDKRGTTLTPAGEQLRADAAALLAGAEALRRRVTRAARGPNTFTVAFMPGLIVTAAIRAFAQAHPEPAVEVLRTSWDDQTEVLRDGRADVSYVRLPADRAGLSVVPLFTEPRGAILPADHPLADKQEIHLADLAEDTLIQPPGIVPEWRTLLGDARVRVPPGTMTVEEKLEHIVAGKGIIVLPQSAAAYYRRPDIVYVPITDIDPNQVVLAWDAARRSTLIRDFTRAATETAHS
jgi:DNA-binding transcriptional LysR family regulator